MVPLDSTSETPHSFDGFIGRVPIYNRSLDLYGYDLRVCTTGRRPSAAQPETADDPLILASEKVELNSLVGAKPGLVSANHSLLAQAENLSWPREQMILRIHRDSITSDSTLSQIRELASHGYTVALDGANDLADIAKTQDCASICLLDAVRWYDSLRDNVSELHDTGLKLMARNIETEDQYRLFQELDFDLFQGEYFERPRAVSGTTISANRIAVLDLLSRLQNPDIRIEELEALVSQDLTLSYKILRLINTAFFGMPKRVESIRRAVVFFGLERLKNWVSVLVFNAAEYKPEELLITALVRARTCEYLAMELGRKNVESYYIAGMFSTLDAIMNVPMPLILERLKLAEDIDKALLEGTGPIGDLLTSVLAIESGVCYQSASRLLQDGLALRAYTTAINWATEVRGALRE